MKNLKVLMLNGSPHANGNTVVALREMEKVFMENGVACSSATTRCAAALPATVARKRVNASLMMWSMTFPQNLKRRTALLWQALFITPPRMRRYRLP